MADQGLSPEERTRVEIAARYYLSNGPSFEQMIRDKKRDDPSFAWFFDPSSPGYRHYQRCVAPQQADAAAPPASLDLVPAGVLATLVAHARHANPGWTPYGPLDAETVARFMHSLPPPEYTQPSAAVLAALSRYDAGGWPD